MIHYRWKKKKKKNGVGTPSCLTPDRYRVHTLKTCVDVCTYVGTYTETCKLGTEEEKEGKRRRYHIKWGRRKKNTLIAFSSSTTQNQGSIYKAYLGYVMLFSGF